MLKGFHIARWEKKTLRDSATETDRIGVEVSCSCQLLKGKQSYAVHVLYGERLANEEERGLKDEQV